MSGVLYIVSTPIGNIEDISLRALRTLREVDLIVAESVRVTRKLLRHYQIETPVIALTGRHIDKGHQELIVKLKSGHSLALVCDAGTPLISDSGQRFARKACKEHIDMKAIPGATAGLAALTVSGLLFSGFVFLGSPPRTILQRNQFFRSIVLEIKPIIIYESSRYLRNTLEQLCKALESNRIIVIHFNLTCSSEKSFRGSLMQMAQQFQSPERGQYVLVIDSEQSSKLKLPLLEPILHGSRKR